jgi:hypothetical protein
LESVFYVDFAQVDWSGRHEDSCGSARPRETPQERSDEEASGLPAESEVPGAEINNHVNIGHQQENKFANNDIVMKKTI